MSISIPYVTDAWHWLGHRLQAEATATQREQRKLDLLAKQSDSFSETAGLKTLAVLHGLGAWIVKTPSALAYGAGDFAATVATDIPAAIRAIPETVQHSGNEIYAGGQLLFQGKLSEGLTRVLDGITGDTMIILGARGAMRGVVKAAPEAVRLTKVGYENYASAMNAVIEAARSKTLTTPGTPLDAWMRHHERGTAMARVTADPIPDLIHRAATTPWTRNGVSESCEPYEQLLSHIEHKPNEIAPYVEQIVQGIATNDRMARAYKWLVLMRPEVAKPHHLDVFLRRGNECQSEAVIGEFTTTHPRLFEAAHISTMMDIVAQHQQPPVNMIRALGRLSHARPELFTAAQMPRLIALVRYYYGGDHPLFGLMTRRPHLFTSEYVSDLMQEVYRKRNAKHSTLAIDTAWALSHLFTANHVATLGRSLKEGGSHLAWLPQRLADLRPDLEPAFFQGLLSVKN